jgi:signaling intermediate in Toll pathway protein
MLFRVQPSFQLFLRRIPIFSNRIYASSTAPRSDDEWEEDKKQPKDDKEEEANIASMIGPYISSKQIAFHTGQFDSEQIEKKNKQAFLDVIEAYKIQFPNRRGHVEFIRAALRRMKDFGVERDAESYKKLLSVFPVGPYRHQSMLQVSVRFWPKQNETASTIVSAMESQGIPPDLEVVHMLREIFGPWAHPVRRFARFLYWAPKFINKNPYPIPWELPNDERALARLALQRMTSTVDMETKLVDIHSSTDGSADIEHPIEEHSWLMYTYTPRQMKLAAKLPADKPIYIEGPFGVYLRKKQLKYFVLKADQPMEYWERKKDLEKFNTDDVSNLRSPFQPGATLYIPPSVHELDDGIILSLCIIGKPFTSLINCWLYHLRRHSMPQLNHIAVVDRTKLTEEKQIKQFYSSHLVGTPEFIIPHDTKRLAEEPRPWWFRDKTDDEDE